MKKWLKRLLYFFLVLFILLNVICAFHAYKFTHYYDKKDITELSFGKRNIAGKLGFIFFGPKFPKSEITKKPGAPFKDVAITTEDGVKLAAWHLQHGASDSNSSKGTILMFHGAASCRSSLVDEIDTLYRLGWNIFTIDFRGNGESEGYTSTFSYREIKDLKAAYDYVKAAGENNIYLYGESMGAGTILRAMSLYKLPVKGIIIDGAFGSMREGVRGRVRIMGGLPVEPFATLICFWGGLEEGYWAFGINQWDYAEDITCSVLVQRGMIDPRVTEEETQHIYRNLASRDKKLVEYPGCGHESFYAKLPAEWLKNVTVLLKK